MFNGEIYNILSNNFKVKDIIDIIKKMYQLDIEFVENEIMNQLSYEVSRKKFENTNFNFRGNIEKAVFDTISLLKNNM